jgi:hypothetical protein
LAARESEAASVALAPLAALAAFGAALAAFGAAFAT